MIRRRALNIVVREVEDAELGKGAEATRELLDLVDAELELLEVGQVGEGFRQGLQGIVGQNHRLQLLTRAGQSR